MLGVVLFMCMRGLSSVVSASVIPCLSFLIEDSIFFL